jgi:XTP/dITP diphosphohydrolase
MKILLASRNKHKMQEIAAILGKEFAVLTLREFPDAPELIEDADSFVGNATRKSVQLANWLVRANQLVGIDYVLADDSGLAVDALNGAPGVHSARFANLETGETGNAPDARNNEKLLRLLNSIPDENRTARFQCALALTPIVAPQIEPSSRVCSADPLELQTEIFEGACEGRLLKKAAGAGGFGYDPLFVPVGFVESFAELSEETKNRISHRAKALEKLRVRLSPGLPR